MTIREVRRRQIEEDEKAAFHKHVCPPTHGGPPPDPVAPTVTLARNLLVTIKHPLPDGSTVPMWVIEDPDDPVGGQVFPSPTIRVREGDVVHVRVGSRVNTHTIHWHGIEPTPMNDGVGKHSFEVTGNFTYQWLAAQSGTYFYHCHKNTTLHFEMGLYGLLLIDPPQGKGFVAGFNPPDHIIPYDVEGILVVDEIDSRWHFELENNHDAFMQKCDPEDPVNPAHFTQNGFLNDFRPDIFVINGVARVDDDTPIMDPGVAINAKVGQTILLRLLHSGYTIQRYTIGIDAEAIAFDGRPFGVPPFGKYSRPFIIAAGEPFILTVARRIELIIRPTKPGVFPVVVEFQHDITRRRLAFARTVINVI
ncbi:MAG: multicopper oxidase domain-containing protein [Nitrospirae bacterium]|nr:multicopper oxidase domain-containing protein [Nitrospirota bacterium]